MNDNKPKLNVLLVEDVASKTRFIREALEQSRNSCRLHAVGTGQDTLSYLRRDGPYASAPTPDLVLFDISDARKRDLEILDRVQKDTLQRDIPMVLLTSARSEQILEDTYDGHRGLVVFSPIELDHFLKSMRSRKSDRFLSAVSLIQKLGFVLVRLPVEFSEIRSGQSFVAAHQTY